MFDRHDSILYRYCAESWPQILGHRPFIATGPRFKDHVIKGSLAKHGQWIVKPELRWALMSLYPRDGIHRAVLQHEAVAEFLLREEIIQALWSVDSDECVYEDDRWDESISQVMREIPYHGDSGVEEWTVEYLSGLSGPEHFRSYLLDHTSLTLESVKVPPVIR